MLLLCHFAEVSRLRDSGVRQIRWIKIEEGLRAIVPWHQVIKAKALNLYLSEPSDYVLQLIDAEAHPFPKTPLNDCLSSTKYLRAFSIGSEVAL